MNKKHFSLLLILIVCFGVVGLFSDSVYSQSSSWNPPQSIFPLGGGEKKIFDEKVGPGEARVSSLVFNGTGQALNFAPGQSIKGGSNGNAQIMFTPQGITISSLAGPVSFNTKGIVLKDMGQSGGTSAVTAATGTITRIGGGFKYNIDGTSGGWKDVGGEGMWKRGTSTIYYDGGKSGGGWLYVGTKTKQTNGTFAFIKKAHATVIQCDPEKGDTCGGGGTGGGTVDTFYTGESLKCNLDNEIRDCPLDFYPDGTTRNAGTRGYDEFIEGGVIKRAIYEYTPEVTGGLRTVTVGASGATKDLIVNGNLEIGGKLSFSPKKIFQSDNVKVGPGGSNTETKTIVIKDTTSGRTDFSFCALGYRWIDANPRSYCEVFYDSNERVWKITAYKWQDAGVECRANCF